MTLQLGKVKPGSTIYIPFPSYSSAGASLALSGLAATDIEIYKDGSVTQRASDNGYTLLDTDGIDFDGVVGANGFSISLADNSDAGFYAAGSRYFVWVASVTIDSQTVNVLAAVFEIAVEGAVLSTTIATLASQTSFTLTAGPAEDDALNGCVCYIHDVASAVQGGFAVVLDYTGSTKTVTLAAGTTFTAAATDNIGFFPPANTQWANSVAWGAGAITAGTMATASLASGVFGTGAITATAIAANAIGASELAADAATEIADAVWATAARTLTALDEDSTTLDLDATIRAAVGLAAADLDTQLAALPTAAENADAVWDEDATGHQTGGTFGQAIGDPAADTNTIYGAVVTGAAGATVAADIIAVKAETAAILEDTGTTLDGKIDTIDTVVDAIKVQTDKFVFTVANVVNANITYVNEAEVTGDGQPGTEWGPA